MPETGVFSTAGLPAARRVELWEAHNAAALIGLSCHAAVPLEATEVNVPLGRVQLARVTGSPHLVERTAEVIRRSPTDAVAVYVTLRGEAWFRHRDGTRELRPGQVLICEADQPFGRGFARGLEELAVKVPRAALAPLRSPVVAAFTPGGDPYARALARLVGRATRAERAVAADEGTVLDLVATLAGGRAAARTAALRAAARCFIEEHLADPGLGAAQVAAATGISERHLSRVFAADGSTVPRHVLARRLQLAYAMLADPAPGGTAPGSTAPGSLAVADLRHPADLPRADPGQERDRPRHPDPVLHRVPGARARCRRGRRAGA